MLLAQRKKATLRSKFIKAGIAFGVFVCLNACSVNESKIKAIVEREVGADLFVEKARLELEKQLGKTDCRLKSTMLEMVESKIEIEYTEVIIEGRRARLKVNARVPRLEDIGAIFSEARSIPKSELSEMSATELIKYINKSGRRPASENELRVEHYEFFVDFEKNKEWFANQDQLKRAYSKKNLVPYLN